MSQAKTLLLKGARKADDVEVPSTLSEDIGRRAVHAATNNTKKSALAYPYDVDVLTSRYSNANVMIGSGYASNMTSCPATRPPK